jgi:cyclopropane fatty-acyl-phospholipid synthase-like methyltransferase
MTTGTRHLDVGCGAGMALQMSADRGATVSGIEFIWCSTRRGAGYRTQRRGGRDRGAIEGDRAL